MTNWGMYLKMMVLAWAFTAMAAGLHPDRGVSMIWYGSQSNLDDRDGVVKNGQIFFMWRSFEPTRGTYDFDRLDQELRALHNKGMKATIQINGNKHPDYIFDLVPYLKGKAYSGQRDHTIGYGPVMYWHDAYKQRYEAMIQAVAGHVKNSPYRAMVLGIRQSFNAIGTEHTTIKPEDRTRDNWTCKEGATWGGPWPWTSAVKEEYQTWAIDMYIEHFDPPAGVPVFIRASSLKGSETTARHKQMVRNGELMIFQTSSEPQPRNSSKNAQYQMFVEYCKTGDAWGFMESWSSSRTSEERWLWNTTSKPITHVQWNYWTLLCNLHCGASFPAMRPEDIDRAEFRTDYEFTARYAGYHHAPARSPGAWIAFREGDYLKGDYTFLMNRGSDATVALYNLDDTRYGLWARRLRAGASTTLTMNESFTSSLVGNTGVNVRVRYKDNGNGSFTVAAFGKSFTGQKSGGGGWKVAEFTTSVSANAPQIEIRAVGDDLVLHMVEVLRGTSGQVRVPGGPRNAVPLSSTRTVVRVFDMRGRMLMRLVGETAPEQIAQRIRQRQGAGCYLLTRASNGTERQWISRVILEE